MKPLLLRLNTKVVRVVCSVVLFLLICSDPANGKDLGAVDYLTWQSSRLVKMSNGQMLTEITGKTRPHTNLSFASPVIPMVLPGGESQSVPVWQATSSPEIVADSNGIFILRLKLPYGLANLSLRLRFSDSEEIVVQLPVEMNRTDAKIVVDNVVEDLRSQQRHFAFAWGPNYLAYDQSDNENSPQFETLSLASFSFEFLHPLSSDWTFESDLHLQLSEIPESSSLTLNNSSLTWSTAAIRALGLMNKWRHNLWGWPADVELRLSTLYHLISFVSTDSTAVTPNESIPQYILALSVGAGYFLSLSNKSTLKVELNYQLPMSSGDVLELSPIMGLDGAIEYMYRLDSHWELGVSWWGTWLNYDFQFDDPKFNHRVEGDLNIIFSEFDFKVKYLF